MVDPEKLEIIPDSEFNINLKPELFDKNQIMNMRLIY